MSSETTYIFDEDFVLQNETARRLYFDYAKNMPIIDYHCHLPVDQIAEDYNFENITEIWLKGDHYKWRAMRTLGVEEKYITGDASDKEKFLKWAEIVPETLRNPLFHWTHLELKDPFDVKTYLNKANAEAIYEHCNALLQKPEFSAQNLLKHFNVQTVCTTDDPCDTLEFHRQLKNMDTFTEVFPAFRPDKALNIHKSEEFRTYIYQLSKVGNKEIKTLDDLLSVFEDRIGFFDKNGCDLADHGLNYIPVFDSNKQKETNNIFKKVLGGDDSITKEEVDQYMGSILFQLCQFYQEKGWVQQFHLGALRNTNTNKFEQLGPDTGFDSMGEFAQAPGLVQLLDKLEQKGKLTKTILYNLNPKDNELFATMVGNFNKGPIKGKLQYGAAWWFLDQLDGMEKQINDLSNMGILSCFVGMLTDSRSFLSYSRHDYFRRLLCNIFGKDIEAGLLPNDEKWIGGMIEDICYNNADNYFNFNS